jgi:hypothetical protein
VICAVSASLGATACSSDSTADPNVSTADAYSAAIRWYLDSIESTATTATTGTTDSGPLIVYVAPESGKAINSQAQASVVREMSDMSDIVTVRFADVRDDALQSGVETLPVKDDGVLLLVGDVPDETPPVDVHVAVYHDVDDTHTFVMQITASGDSFRATEVSEVAQG